MQLNGFSILTRLELADGYSIPPSLEIAEGLQESALESKGSKIVFVMLLNMIARVIRAPKQKAKGMSM